jgi:hypothetical protein
VERHQFASTVEISESVAEKVSLGFYGIRYRKGEGERTVIVVTAIRRPLELIWHSVTEQCAPDLVRNVVCLVLVERQQDEGVLQELLVAEEWGQEFLRPCSGESDVGVVAVVGHVGRDPHPLGQLVGFEVLVELGKVLDVGDTARVVLD